VVTERRYDPLTGEWRIFAPAGLDRTSVRPSDQCPLCPTRPGGPVTEVPAPAYQIAVLDDRFPSMTAHPPAPALAGTQLYGVAPALGAAELVLYTDRHDQTFADLDVARIARLVDVWADRYAVLGSRDEIEYVFVFENKGTVLGVTLEHPHGQVFGFPDLPPAVHDELTAAQRHLEQHGTCVVCDVVAHERSDGVRVVAANEHFVAYVPFAARFPYEVHVTSTRHATSLLDLSDPERLSLAALLKQVTQGFDALFDRSLPYVMSMHQAPVRGEHWLAVSHLHLEFTPPNRTADTLKHLAGPELGARAFVNDTQPEQTAAQLRDAVHKAVG
jgi:UDPglucose--hexose-1-phosphate uridylyltransferase